MEQITRRLAAVAFADVAGWSRLVEDNDVAALRGWNALRRGLIEPRIGAHHGRLVDSAGDAVFVEFPSAVDALRWALDVQGRLGDDAAPGERLWLRIGINVGDLLVDGERLVGDAVNVASRIHQLAAPGEIVITEAVHAHVGQRVAIDFRDLGEHRLKNIGHPVHVYCAETAYAVAPQHATAGAAEGARHTRLVVEAPRTQRLARLALAAGAAQLVERSEQRLVLTCADAREALQLAFALQASCSDDPLTALPRIGLQLAAPRDDDEAAVADRLLGLAAPGEIVASAGVRDRLTAGLDAEIEDLGESRLEGLDTPVRAYRLAAARPAEAAADAPADADDELQPSIAVVPFSERGEGFQPMGELLAEELIAGLSRARELAVVSRLSSTAFRDRGAAPREVGARLRADYVLSGSYRVSAGALYLTAELAEARSARVVWAAELRGRVAALVEGRDELIDRLVAEVSGAVMARELARARSQSLHSLQTCTLLVGAVALMHRLSLHDFRRAYDMLRLVVQRAPRHPVPLAWLAKWHVLRVWQGWSGDAAADARLALDCGRRALDNDSHCSLALATDGFVHTNLLRDLEVARQRYDLALACNPNDAQAWLFSGMLHAFKGEGRQAVRQTRRALRLSPLDPHRYFYEALAGGAELAAGHYERAIQLTRHSLRANRMHASTFRMLAIAQWQAGRQDEARATVAELLRIEPGLGVARWLERSPARDYPIGQLCAEALRGAGVPA